MMKEYEMIRPKIEQITIAGTAWMAVIAAIGAIGVARALDMEAALISAGVTIIGLIGAGAMIWTTQVLRREPMDAKKLDEKQSATYATPTLVRS
jgi:hypothetical protein